MHRNCLRVTVILVFYILFYIYTAANGSALVSEEMNEEIGHMGIESDDNDVSGGKDGQSNLNQKIEKYSGLSGTTEYEGRGSSATHVTGCWSLLFIALITFTEM